MKFIATALVLLLLNTSWARAFERDYPELIDLPVVHAESKAFFSLDGALIRSGEATRELPCPDDAAIDPCLCTLDTDGGMILDCSAVESEDQLAEIFLQDFPSTAFKIFTVNNNDQITAIGDIFNGLTFVEFVFVNVPNLESITEAAMVASVDTLELVYLNYTAVDAFGIPLATLSDYTVMRELALITSELSILLPLQSESLQELRVYDSNVPALNPGTLDFLPSLNLIEVAGSSLTALQEGSIPLTNTAYSAYFNDNSISTVEVGTFVLPAETDSLSLVLNLAHNSIALLEEEVYGEVFPYVVDFVISGNPLECGCDLAWLVTNSDFLGVVDAEATCDDGTLVADLDPTYFGDNC